MKNNALVLTGAVVGGVIGYFGFLWLVRQGMYGIILPGGLAGIGAGFFRSRSYAIPAVCGIFALALGIFSEWKFAPFVANDSLSFFMTHIQDLKPITLIMIGIGGAIGFWVPFRRAMEARKAESAGH
jgi:hypothetical protein